MIEVLVALVILAIIMLSVAMLCQHAIRFSSRIRDHLDATWIAENALAELQLGLTSLPKDSETQTKEETLDGIQWQWQASTAATKTPNILRVDISISKKNDSSFQYQYQGYTRGGDTQ